VPPPAGRHAAVPRKIPRWIPSRSALPPMGFREINSQHRSRFSAEAGYIDRQRFHGLAPAGSDRDAAGRAPAAWAAARNLLRRWRSWAQQNTIARMRMGSWTGGRHPAPQQRTVGRRQLAWLRLPVFGVVAPSGLWTSSPVGAAAAALRFTRRAVAFVPLYAIWVTALLAGVLASMLAVPL